MNRIAPEVIMTVALALLAPAMGRVQADDLTTKPRVALRGLDPISLVEGKEVPGVEDLAVTRGRHRYLFAEARHKASFEKEPDRYSLRDGGGCAVMPVTPASPDLFAAHGGRIYYFASPRCRAAFEGSPAEYLKPRKNVAILIYEGVELLDFAGPDEVFSTAGEGRAYDVFLVAATSGPITSQGFASVTPRYTIADCPRPDILVIPGGATQIPAGEPAVIEWIRAKSRDAEVVLSVCSGALLLSKAGLLDGLEATTHRDRVAMLTKMTPKAKIVEGRRFVDSGKIVTSAGVSAGIDASLHVLARLLGEPAASDAARRMEYDRRSVPPGEPR